MPTSKAADKPKVKPKSRRDRGVATSPKLVISGKMPRPPAYFKTKFFELPVDVVEDIKRYVVGPETVAVAVLLRMQIEILKVQKGPPQAVQMPDFIEAWRAAEASKSDTTKDTPAARRDGVVASEPKLIINGKMPRPPNCFKAKLFDLPIDITEDIKRYVDGPETVAVVVLLRMQLEVLKKQKDAQFVVMPDYIEAFRGKPAEE